MVSCMRLLTNVSLNSQCDNVEPREARMVNSRRWINIFFAHLQGHLLLE
jgi:hypothetical protein